MRVAVLQNKQPQALSKGGPEYMCHRQREMIRDGLKPCKCKGEDDIESSIQADSDLSTHYDSEEHFEKEDQSNLGLLL
jgi:hypothetical protein